MSVPKRYEQAGAIRGDGKMAKIIDDETMEKLLSCTFYGNKVDF